MKVVRAIALTLAIASIGMPAWAAQTDPHQGHHPAAAATTPAAAPAPASSPMSDMSSHDMARMDAQMKTMHETHARMMAAKTPDERNALMAEHMKSMQDGMGMMNAMFPAAWGT